MKTYFLLFTLACALPFFATAQTAVSLSGGLNFPVGQYHKLTEPFTGSGKTGLVTELSAQRVFYKWIGLSATLRYTKNNFSKECVQELEADWMTADPWKAYSALLGPVAHVRFKKISVNVIAQGGYSYLAKQGFVGNWGPDPSNGHSYVQHDADGSWAFLTGINFSFSLFNNISCGMAGNYFTTQHELHYKIMTLRSHGTEEMPGRSGERVFLMPSVSAQIFVTYKF